MRNRGLADIEEILLAAPHPSIRELYEIWEQRQPIVLTKSRTPSASEQAGQIRWLQSDAGLAVVFLQHALANEEFLLVCDAFREAIAFWSGQPNVDPGQLAALCSSYAAAKTRLGQTGDALRQLEPWARDARLSRKERAGVLLQLGDTMQEECDSASSAEAQFQSGEHALKYYEQALGLWPASIDAHIRCAAMALRISGNTGPRLLQARQWAAEAIKLISETEPDSSASFHLQRSKAVALVVLGKLEEANEAYRALQSCPEVAAAQLAEARYESERLALAAGQPATYFHPAFPPLQLIVFAGHMPDPDGTDGRFPRELIPQVRQALRSELEKLQARTALVSAAAGADLLFIEALMERPGAKLHLVLPWAQDEFFKTSVEPFDRAGEVPLWRPLFEKALQMASTVRQFGQFYEPGDQVGWQYAEEVTSGLAMQTARQSRLALQPLVLWDRKPGRAGGTASFFELWTRHLGKPPIIIDMPAAQGVPTGLAAPAMERSQRSTVHREVKSMLFADIVGYSRLTEKAINEFVGVFLRRFSRLVADSPYSPIVIDTWGDAIYAVFDFAGDAGRFAIQLVNFVHEGREEWLRLGLYSEEADPGGTLKKIPLNIRVGLHTGPVLAHYNHVVRKISYTGSHVSRAARIEPVAESGAVYASEEFAAMVSLESGMNRLPASREDSHVSAGFECEYAGSMSLAKHYPGRFRIYRVVERRNLPLEQLAIAAHSLYCAEQQQQGLSAKDVPALLPWTQLPEDLRQANRSQVADIPYKLSLLGFALTTGPGETPDQVRFTPDEVERLARQEHDRWMKERERMGWRYAPVRDNARKSHPSMVPWESLPDSEKEKDRAVVRNLPKLIAAAGLRLKRQSNGYGAGQSRS